MYALGRERVLPGVFARTSRRGAPKTASLVQSVLALVVIVTWAAGGWDPVVSLFYVAGTAGALGVLMLLLVVAVAVAGYFASDRRGESTWHTCLAPLTAVALLSLVLAAVAGNFAALLGVPDSSPLRWGIPAGYLVVAAGGYGYGLVLKRARPQVYAGIGRGVRAALPAPAAQRPGYGVLFPNGPLSGSGDGGGTGPLRPPAVVVAESPSAPAGGQGGR
jgi:amino acid transporter